MRHTYHEPNYHFTTSHTLPSSPGYTVLITNPMRRTNHELNATHLSRTHCDTPVTNSMCRTYHELNYHLSTSHTSVLMTNSMCHTCHEPECHFGMSHTLPMSLVIVSAHHELNASHLSRTQLRITSQWATRCQWVEFVITSAHHELNASHLSRTSQWITLCQMS